VTKPRFLLDEHINRAIQRQLRRLDAQVQVLAVGDAGAPPSGIPDPDLLIWIEENGYILVTENRRTLPSHLADHYAAGRDVPGIFWLRPSVQVVFVILLIPASFVGICYSLSLSSFIGAISDLPSTVCRLLLLSTNRAARSRQNTSCTFDRRPCS